MGWKINLVVDENTNPSWTFEFVLRLQMVNAKRLWMKVRS
jgi:hypothetical protein